MRKLACLLLLSLGLIACQSGDQSDSKKVHAAGGVIAASISQDGRLALIASVNHPSILWDLDKQEPLYNWNNSKKQGAIIATAFSPEGKFALTAEEKNVALWNTKTGQTEAYWLIKSPILSIALGQGGHYALVGFTENKAEYIDLHDGRSIRRFKHQDKVNTVAISNNERYALTGSDDKTAILWNTQTGQTIHTWPHKKRVTLVRISPDNRYALSNASQEDVMLWDMRTGKKIHQLNSAPMTLSAASFSPDGRYLATGNLPQSLILWDLATGKSVKTWRLSKPTQWKPSATIIRAIRFSADGRHLITEDSRGEQHAWKLPKS